MIPTGDLYLIPWKIHVTDFEKWERGVGDSLIEDRKSAS